MTRGRPGADELHERDPRERLGGLLGERRDRSLTGAIAPISRNGVTTTPCPASA